MGLLSGLLGLDNNYGADGYQKQQRRNLGNLENNAGLYGQQYRQNIGQFNAYAPQESQAVQNYAAFLGRDPGTDAYGTALTQRYAGNAAGNYVQGAASLMARNARRGFGGNSGDVQGGLAALENGRVQAVTNAQYQYGADLQQQQMQRLAMLQNLYGQQADNAFGRANQSLGAQNALYGGLADNYGQMAQQGYARQAQNTSNLFGGITGLVGGIADLYGRRK